MKGWLKANLMLPHECAAECSQTTHRGFGSSNFPDVYLQSGVVVAESDSQHVVSQVGPEQLELLQAAFQSDVLLLGAAGDMHPPQHRRALNSETFQGRPRCSA